MKEVLSICKVFLSGLRTIQDLVVAQHVLPSASKIPENAGREVAECWITASCKIKDLAAFRFAPEVNT